MKTFFVLCCVSLCGANSSSVPHTTEYLHRPRSTAAGEGRVLPRNKNVGVKSAEHYFKRLSGSSLPILQNDPADCFVPELELLMLIDISSGTWEEFVLPLTSKLAVVLEDAMTVFPRSRVALSTFSDKPIPHHGRGNFGGFGQPDRLGGPVELDTCYEMNSPFTGFNDEHGVREIIDQLRDVKGQGGMDTEEAQLDALVRAASDSDLHWSPLEDDIERVVIMFTDSVGHEAGWKNGSSWISAWNAEVTCVNETSTTGGFGASNFPGFGTSPSFVAYDIEAYALLQELYAKKLCGSGVSGDEAIKLAQLWIELGPRKFPELSEHPGDNSKGCGVVEYPSYKMVTDTLNREHIHLIVMYLPPVETECVKHVWDWILSDPSALGNISAAFINLEPTLQTMYEMVFTALTDVLTWEPCTTPAPTTVPTSKTEIVSETTSSPPTTTSSPPTTPSPQTSPSSSSHSSSSPSSSTPWSSTQGSVSTSKSNLSTESIATTDHGDVTEVVTDCLTVSESECVDGCDQVLIAVKERPKRLSLIIRNE